MSFIDIIKENFNNEQGMDCKFRAILFGDSGGYFECVKCIEQYSSEQIAFRVKNQTVVVRGTGLYIKSYCEGDLVICGKINVVERP